MFLLQTAAVIVGGFLVFCALLSIGVWIVCGEGWRDLRSSARQWKVRWITRRNLKRRSVFDREWNPRPTAFREFARMDTPIRSARPQHAKTVSINRGSVRTNVRVIRSE